VARTIADLGHSEIVSAKHVAKPYSIAPGPQLLDANKRAWMPPPSALTCRDAGSATRFSCREGTAASLSRIGGKQKQERAVRSRDLGARQDPTPGDLLGPFIGERHSIVRLPERTRRRFQIFVPANELRVVHSRRRKQQEELCRSMLILEPPEQVRYAAPRVRLRATPAGLRAHPCGASGDPQWSRLISPGAPGFPEGRCSPQAPAGRREWLPLSYPDAHRSAPNGPLPRGAAAASTLHLCNLDYAHNRGAGRWSLLNDATGV
jgi:hypothetical protein